MAELQTIQNWADEGEATGVLCDVGVRPVCPAGTLQQNLQREKRRKTSYTDSIIGFREPPRPPVEDQTAIKLASMPLYSSFGRGQVFNPMMFMPKRWKSKMTTQGREPPERIRQFTTMSKAVYP